MTIEILSRQVCVEEDGRDPLRRVRDSFLLPSGVIFMGGNSLGALSRPVAERVARTVQQEWGEGLLRSWNEAGWIDAPKRAGDKLARLLGAAPNEVIVTDSTTVNLFKVMAAVLGARPGRGVILTEQDNFPTDLYVAQGVAELLGATVRIVPREHLVQSLDESVALLTLTHVDYQSSERHDMAAMTAAAHDAGAFVLWDLSHSAGAVPVDLHSCDVDLAVGCTYKYLNGGPGAPAYLFVADRLQAEIRQPIWGWMGHAAPFSFASSYVPAEGMEQYLSGTPPMIAVAALEAALDLWLELDQPTVWEKGRALAELTIRLIETRTGAFGASVVSPRQAEERGSHLTVRHPEAYPVMRALIDRGVIGDFRPPDLMRFSITPLYLRYVDIWDAIEHLREILETRAYDRPEYRQRRKVT